MTKTFFHKTETKTKTSVSKTETKTKTSVGKTETKTKTSLGKIETKTFASFLFSVLIYIQGDTKKIPHHGKLNILAMPCWIIAQISRIAKEII